MASTEAAQLPPAATRQSNFEQAVACALHLWPALTLAVQNGWGGPDSADKRDWFAGAVVDLFPEFADAQPGEAAKTAAEEPDMEDVETVLLQVMVDEFEVNIDDDSTLEVARSIVKARSECAIGEFNEEVKKLRERFANRKGTKVDQMFKQAEDQDQDTDWESGDSGEDDDEENGGDVDMDEAPPLVSVPKEKPAPEVDEDGFTKVTRKKR
ncbi:Pre-rRNA-processing protein TSR2 [Trichoderma ghanense]|uniref:Pre-rRNA-processing protein TSR2 n=1 Tax=Trichoderma ghanense TaxID=65468 RepID=A0ABY2HFR3_9HYPO